MKSKIIVCWIIGVIELVILINLILIFIFPSNKNIGKIDEELYNIIAKGYHDDPAVLNISRYCQNSTKKVECVYHAIPFEYDYDRGVVPLIRSPKDIVRMNGLGVCRDISIFKKAVLNNLGIESKYIRNRFHIYVVAYENSKYYELNNQNLISKELF